MIHYYATAFLFRPGSTQKAPVNHSYPGCFQLVSALIKPGLDELEEVKLSSVLSSKERTRQWKEVQLTRLVRSVKLHDKMGSVFPLREIELTLCFFATLFMCEKLLLL